MRTFHGNQYVYVRHPARKPIDWSMRIAMVSVAIYTSAIIVGATVKPPTLRAENPSIFSEVEFATPSALLVNTEIKIAGVSGEMKEATTENILAEIARVFKPHGKKVIKEALDIAMCESGWRANAYNFNTNKTGDYNVFQINSVHEKRFGTEFRHNWIENIRVAHVLYEEQGWGPWVCARKLGIVH